MKDIHEILKRVYGYSTFRGGQEDIINNIMSGRDVFAVMPTGAGKSICYQVPALAFDGIALVISPLISLMQDQVRMLISNGVRAAYLNSSLTPGQLRLATDNARRGIYKIIYVAPERLLTESFLSFAVNARISLIAVDEAHCISQWGHDFRPGYLRIAEFISRLPKRPPVAAMTATATSRVSSDIKELLELRDPFCFTAGFDRPNLYFGICQPADKDEFILSYLERRKDSSGIIYCSTRQETERLAQVLCERDVCAAAYHAGMSDEIRRRVQEDFTYDRIRVITATNAFGMGIDKPDVRFVIHNNMPGSLEDYYQQAGRAGRDGEPADCILLYSGRDVRLQSYLASKIPDNDELTPAQRKEQIRVRDEKLRLMTFYSTSRTVCLRKRILNYFGEKSPERCSSCSVCLVDINERVFGKNNSTGLSVDEELLAMLRSRARLLSIQFSVPVYTVASDGMLREMSAAKPKNSYELHKISGFGEERIRRFGKPLLDVVINYLKAQKQK